MDRSPQYRARAMTRAVLWASLVILGPGALEAQNPACAPPAARLVLDLDRSVVRWRGTKFFGLGSHEGVVRLKAGELCVQGGVVTAGSFVVDLTTIAVTDIPASDPVPRNRLRDHLLSEDFFHVAAHPEARFRIGSVTPQHGRLLSITGALTIRERTHPVTFYARGWTITADRVEGTARFAVDRHKYDVSYVGSTIKDDLVDDEFWLDIEIRATAAPASAPASPTRATGYSGAPSLGPADPARTRRRPAH